MVLREAFENYFKQDTILKISCVRNYLQLHSRESTLLKRNSNTGVFW